MKRIALFSDIHGNVFALQALLKACEKVDEIICLGDVVAMGPDSSACLRLMRENKVTMINGNHEMYAIYGTETFSEVGADEACHQKWVRDHLEKDQILYLKDQPYKIQRNIAGVEFVFCHYAMKEGKFIGTRAPRTAEVLDELYGEMAGEFFVYGHEHEKINQLTQGKRQYFCVGSSGCTSDDMTHYTLLSYDDSSYHFEKVMVPYEREAFVELMNTVDYPEKTFIRQVFFKC